jgi:periplasmic protein CpxP/Spy
MKTHKTLIAVLAAGSLLTLSSLAADTNTPPPGGPPGIKGRGMQNLDDRVDKIAKDMSLTDDQKAKLKAAFETRRQKAMELMQDNNLSNEDKAAKRKTLMDDFNKSLKDAGFTQDQIDKIDQMGPGGRMRGQRGPGGPGGAGGDKPPGDKPAGDNQQ